MLTTAGGLRGRALVAHVAEVTREDARVIAHLGASLWSSGDRWGVGVDALAPAQAFATAATARSVRRPPIQNQ